MRNKKPNTLIVICYCVLIAAVILSFIPVYWIITLSFKYQVDALAMPPKVFFTPTLNNYKGILFAKAKLVGGIFQDVPKVPYFPKYILNSAIITLCTIILGLMIGIPAAYTLSRLKFRSRDGIAFYILLTRFLPPIGIVIPFYLLYSKFHLLDTIIGMVIIYLGFNLPIVIWMLKSFFQEIPLAIEEAALTDGCSRIGAIFRVILPLTAPGIAATAIFVFFLCWNEFLFALMLTGENAKTAPVAILAFYTFREIIWGVLCAGGVLITIVPMIFMFVAQKHLIRGLTFGAMK